MSFERPWLLLLLPALLLLLFVLERARRRRPLAATTFLLFERAARRLPAAPARRRWRPREALGILPAALTALALAGPAVERDRPEPELVVVLDRSASMGTREGGRTRIERGLAEIARAHRGPLRLRTLPHDPAGRPVPPASAGHVASADLVAGAVAEAAAGRPAAIVTDQPLGELPGGIGALVVRDDAPRAGITTAAVDAGGTLLVWVEGDPMPRELVVEALDPQGAPGATLARLALPASGWPHRFERALDEEARRYGLLVRLEPPDAFAGDDLVWLLPEPRRVDVLLPLAGHDAIARALAAIPGVRVRRGDGPADLVVGRAAAGGGSPSLLVAPADAEGFVTGAAAPDPGPLRGQGALGAWGAAAVALPSVAALAAAPAGTETLVAGAERPVLVRQGATLLLLQDPDASTWPRHESFPLLFDALLGMLGLRGGEGLAAHPARRTLEIPAPRGRPVRVVLPSGEEIESQVGADGTLDLVLAETGVHRIELPGADPDGGFPMLLSVAVLDARETLEAPAAAASWRPPAPPSRSGRAPHSLEPWLLLLALAALALVLRCQSKTRRFDPFPTSGAVAARAGAATRRT